MRRTIDRGGGRRGGRDREVFNLQHGAQLCAQVLGSNPAVGKFFLCIKIKIMIYIKDKTSNMIHFLIFKYMIQRC